MPTLNYTTKVSVNQTISEIHTALAKHGASRIATDYNDGKPSGLSFTLPTPSGIRVFRLPVDVVAVHALLTKQRLTSKTVDNRPEQAERVAWRVIREWLIAQLAMVEAQLVSMDQIMLPYMQWDQNRTLYQAFTEDAIGALEAAT